MTEIEPPVVITRPTYKSWIEKNGWGLSPYFNFAMDWTDRFRSDAGPLPAAPDEWTVDVQDALTQTKQLEQEGEIAEGSAAGYDLTVLIGMPLAVVLETQLFFAGKPIGLDEGETHPKDAFYSQATSALRTLAGRDNYFSQIRKAAGGIYSDQNYTTTLLVRRTDGLVEIYGHFIESFVPADDGPSEISIVLLRKISPYATLLRRCFRHTGQHYPWGGKYEAFNPRMIHMGLRPFVSALKELSTTGRISEGAAVH